AFEQHRLPNLAQFAQQIEVLHVARAHLEDVHIRQHQLNLRDLHHFTDHQQMETIARLAQQFQRVEAESLKRIRRRSGFEGTAAKDAGSRFRYEFADCEQLLAGFDGARSSHHDDLLAADFNAVGEFDDRAFGTKVASGQMIGRGDAVNFLHSRKHFDFAGVEITRHSDTAEHGLLRSGGAVDFKAEVDQLIDHLLDLIFTGRCLHCDDHELGSFAPLQSAKRTSALAAFPGYFLSF